ncbi:unnamed protein product [Pelagomonas calceolata]|uniref:Uncharacterized protein n=1 Tax=Pelagomonas calceolata TaxID=35677 RepID=A0A8J2SFE0_9STRA|nr:unnamed protein product [Pelagomonas calceolata]
MPRVWKPAADDQHIFDALPMPEGDVFLSDDELLMEMDGVATRAALNAALGPTARTRVTFDAEGRYWRKSYEIDKEPRCIYFLPAVQNRARALEEYPDGVEPPFPRPEEKFQCKRKQPPRAPRKPSKTTARSGEKRPTSARPRMYTTPGEKVTRVDPVDDAELLVPDEDVVDLDEVAPDAVFARSATDSARLMLLSLDREANALSAERAARRRDVDRLRAKFSQEKELWKIDCERRAAARLDEERRRLEEGFRTNTRELQRQLDAQRTEVADLKKKQSQLNLELYGLRRLRGAWLGSRVAYLPEEPPPDSDFEGESLWPVVHAVGDFLSRICGGTLKRKQQKCLRLLADYAWCQHSRGRGEIGLVRAHFACAEYRRLQEIFSPAELLKTMDVEMTGNYAASEAMRARERAALVALGETLGKHVMLLFPTKFALQETAKLVERLLLMATRFRRWPREPPLYEALDDVTDHFSTAATAQTDGVYQSEAEGRAVHVDYVCSGDMANLQTVSKKGFATGTSENARPRVARYGCRCAHGAQRELPPAYRYMREAKTLSAAQLRELAAEAGLDAGGTSAHLHARFAAYCGQHCLELENPNQNGFYAKFDCRTATPAQKTQFSLVVNDCLVDFGLAVTGNLGSRVEKTRLKLVDQYYELQAQLEHATPNSDALISLVEHMVPPHEHFHIGSGHITAYLRKYRNLYRYSNQGFESVNHLIKRFFLTRTQRGGHCGHEATRATRVAALGKWMQRRMMWLTGLVKPGELKVIGWKQKRVIDW